MSGIPRSGLIGRPNDLIGTPVTEAEAAVSLGFADVFEMRRWDTEMGQKVADLEQKLRVAESDRDNFRWHGRRMQVVLEKVAKYLKQSNSIDDPDILLAIGVVTGKLSDWEHRLKGWFDDATREA